MNKYAEIINVEECYFSTNLTVGEAKATSEEWENHTFCPTNGIVGFVLGEGMAYDGPMIALEVLPNIIVPIRPKGIKFISEAVFELKWRNNSIIGKDITGEKNKKARMNEMIGSLNKRMEI